jgi:PST family polysaccharide transporter
MLKRLRTSLTHPVSQNVIALYAVQLATFIVPIITLPYVVRVLPPSEFGLIIFAQGFSLLLVVFIDWGFSFTGIRSTAESHVTDDDLADVVKRVRGAQLLLSAISIPIALGAFVLVPKMSQHPGYLVLAWVAAVATGLSPGWFFLGTERMRLMAFIQLGFRVLGAVLTFVLVTGAGDGWIVMALFAGSSVGALAAADTLMYRSVKFRLPRWHDSFREIRGATTIFLSTIAVTLYTSFNVVLLGLFVPAAAVAHFGVAERVVRVSITALAPIGAAVIPRLSTLQAAGERERARRLLLVAVAVAAIPALLITAGLIAFAPSIIHLVYGERFVHPSTPIMRVMALIIPVNVIGVVFGVWLLSQHQDRLIAKIVAVAGVANLVLGCILTPLFGPIGMAWSVLSAEAAAAAGGFLIVRRNSRRARVAAVASPGPTHGLSRPLATDSATVRSP